MTRKDFELIARAFRYARTGMDIRWTDTDTSLPAMREFASIMADRLEDTNPNFNREKFIKACFPVCDLEQYKEYN